MNLQKYFFAVLILIGVTQFNSCKENKINKLGAGEVVSYSDTLKTNNVYSLNSEESFYNPIQIENINDEYLLVSEYLREDFFRVFKLPEVNYLYAWGVEGRGPGEFQTTPVYLQFNNQKVIPYDAISKRLKFLSINDTALTYLEEQELRYEGQIEPLNRIVRMNDSLYFADYGSGLEETNAEHIAIEPDCMDSLFTFGSYPETELIGYERYFNFMKSSVAKPDGSKFAAFYLKHNLLKIYDVEGELKHQIEVQDPYLEEKEDITFRSVKSVSNNFIYALGLYETTENVYESSEADLTTSLEIWDWKGKMLFRAQFDQIIHHFSVSEKNGKIYAISNYSMNQLYEYDISEILNKLN